MGGPRGGPNFAKIASYATWGGPEGAQISQKSLRMRPGGLQRGPQARSKRVSDAKRACDTGLLMIMLLCGLLSLTSGAYLDCILRVPGVILDGCWEVLQSIFEVV